MWIDLFSLVIPMLLALGLGILSRKKQLLSPQEVEGLKKLVCSILLPFVVLGSFSSLRFELKTLVLLLMGTAVNLLGYCMGGLGKRQGEFALYRPFLLSSMEAGMLGYALFAMVFGSDKLPYFVIFDAGQAIFFFLFFLPRLQNTALGKKEPIFPQVFKQPIVWTLFLGTLLSLSGIHRLLTEAPIGRIWQKSIELLSAPVSCVMLFVVGYGIKLNGSILRSVSKAALLRMGYMLPVSVLCAFLIYSLGMDRLYCYGLLLFCAMPPSYLLPVYVKGDREQAFVNSFLSLYALYSLSFTLLLFALKQIGG